MAGILTTAYIGPMIRKETRTQPAKEYEETVERKCDLCGRASPFPWDVRVEIEEGYSFPEGGHTVTTLYDICPECFRTKLVPWLEAQGARARKKEVDW
jgi:hypothetical protein